MNSLFLTTLSVPEIREMFRDEIEKYFQKNALNKKVSTVNPHERITRQQVKQEYKISLAKIHKLMRSGELSYEKVGRKTLFRREDVENCFTSKKG